MVIPTPLRPDKLNVEISKDFIDGLGETIQIGLGQAAQVLSGFCNLRFIPKSITIVESSDSFKEHLETRGEFVASNRIRFSGDLNGMGLVYNEKDDANRMSNLIMLTTASDLKISEGLSPIIFNEIGTILTTNVMVQLTSEHQKSIHYSMPDYYQGSLLNTVSEDVNLSDTGIIVNADLDVLGLNAGANFMIFLDKNSLGKMIEEMERFLSE